MISLLISAPPYTSVRDEQAAALCLHLTAPELKAKLARSYPEILVAGPDREDLARQAKVLRDAGMPVLFTHREVVAKVPDAMEVLGFQFGKEGVIWELPDRSFVTPYNCKLLAVLCEPRAGSSLPPRSANKAKSFLAYQKAGQLKRLGMLGGVGATIVSDVELADARRESKNRVASASTPTSSHRLDLYFFIGGKPRRLTLVQGRTRFQGLGNRMAANFRQNLHLLVEEFRTRQAGFHLDERLKQVDFSEPIINGMAYRALWKLIDPSLAGRDRSDLASRLVFLSYCKG